MKYLTDNYKKIDYKTSNLTKEMVISYINDYMYVLGDAKFVEKASKILYGTSIKLESNIQKIMTKSSSYNRSEAVSYANTYYDNYNSNYPDMREYGGDCANFVSQCLNAGGKEEIYTGGYNSTSSWFCDTNDKNSLSKISVSSRGANEFKVHWKGRASSFKSFKVSEVNTPEDFRNKIFSPINKGDAIQIGNSNGRAIHTMLCFNFSSSNYDVIYAAHSASTNSARLLSDKISGLSTDYYVYIYQI